MTVMMIGFMMDLLVELPPNKLNIKIIIKKKDYRIGESPLSEFN